MGSKVSRVGSRFAGCVRFTTANRGPKLEEWSDNRALREAEMQALTKEQKEAFGVYWDD